MAEELTSLRLSIDSTSAIKAEKDLNKLSNSSDNLEKNVKKNNDSMTSSFGSLKTAIIGVGLASLVAEYVKFADQMTVVDSRLKLVTNSLESQIKAQKELFEIAQQTRLGFKETADLYSRIAISTKDYNISQEKLLKITSTINKAMIIGGGTAESMNAAIIQLGQAFSGNFQSVGQELASIREQTPALYQAIVAGSGMTSQAFKKAAEDGELSTEIIIKALEKQASSIEKDFGKVNKTVSQSMTQMTNSIMGFVGEIDKTTGASSLLSDTITSISVNVDSFTKSIKNSNGVMDELSKKANFKLDEDGLLSSILKTNKGAGEALYKVLSETLKIVDQTAGEWSKIIDSSYIGMGKWVESVSVSLGLVESKAKDTKKAVKDIVPSRPTQESYALIEDLPTDTFARSTEMTKKQLEDEFDELKKAQDEKLKLQKKNQEDAEQLNKDWLKHKLELTYENEIALSDEIAKPFIQLEKKYKEDLEKYKDVQGAKQKLIENYYIEADRLQKDAVEKFNKSEEEKAKKNQEFINNSLGLYEDATTKIIQKYTEIFDKAELFTPAQIDKLIENMNDALEKAKPELSIKANIELDPKDLDGTAKAVATIGKNLDKLNKEQKQYQENQKKVTKGSKEWSDNEEQHTENQIYGYANMAGAMSSMFKEGSKDAAAFQAIESGLAVVAGVRAIMTAGTGDPYTAIPRMIAMAAMVASTLSSAGIAFGFGGTKTSTSYGDAVSAQAANTGTGTVLGDANAQSKSISKSMEILKDFAQPQFSVLTQMNKYLASIDEKLGGVSSLIYQNAGYAVGEGYTAPASVKTGLGITFQKNLDKIAAVVDPVSKMFGGATDRLTGIIIGGLFGKTTISQSLADAGIYFGDQLLTSAINEIYGNAYQTISTTVEKKSWFSKSSNTTLNTYFQALDDETERQFSLVLNNLYKTTLLAGEALDTSSLEVAKSLEKFIVSIGKVSLLGKTSDQIKETLEAIFGKIGDSIAQAAFPLLTQFQAVGEGLYETMTRVATGMEEAGYYINLLGKSFTDVKYIDIINKQGNVGFEALFQSIVKADEATYGLSNSVVEMMSNMSGTAEELYTAYKAFGTLRLQLTATGKDITYLTSTMIAGAGGVSELTNGLSDYIENFMSSSEQIAYSTKVMKAQFDSAGITMPKTLEGFRALVESIDITTKSGQDLYGRIIALSGGFADLQDQISNGDLSTLLTNITTFVTSLRTSTTTSVKTTFDTFMTSFNSMIDAINSGSTDLTTIGTTAIANAQSYIDAVTSNATSSRDISFAKSVIANKFEGVVTSTDVTLGTVNETLKISLGEKSAIVMELQALRSQIDYLNSLNTTQTATSVKTLNAVRATIPA